MKKIIIPALLSAVFLQVTWAEDCSKSLVPNVTAIQKDVATRASFLKIINQDNYKELRKDAGLSSSFLYEGIKFGLDVDYKDFDTSRNQYYEKIQYSTSSKDASGYLLRVVPEVSFNAYTDCLRLEALKLDGPHIVPVAITPNTLTIKLVWRAPVDVFKGKATYGQIKGITPASIKNLPKVIKASSETTVVLDLVPNKDVALAFNVGGRSDSISIPATVPQAIAVAPTAPSAIPFHEYDVEGKRRNMQMHTCLEGYTIVLNPNPPRCFTSNDTAAGAQPLVFQGIADPTTYICQWRDYQLPGVAIQMIGVCKRT